MAIDKIGKNEIKADESRRNIENCKGRPSESVNDRIRNNPIEKPVLKMEEPQIAKSPIDSKLNSDLILPENTLKDEKSKGAKILSKILRTEQREEKRLKQQALEDFFYNRDNTIPPERKLTDERLKEITDYAVKLFEEQPEIIYKPKPVPNTKQKLENIRITVKAFFGKDK